MSPIAILILAFGMSIDSFVASVSRGASLRKPPMREILRTGAVFGLVEAMTPVIGWLAGMAASRYVQAYDHWIAFILLSLVGGKMALDGFAKRGAADDAPRGGSIAILIATAIGTSIDAMAVGVTLAFLQVNIVVIAAAIGATTFAMSAGGMLVSHMIGDRFGKWAEVFGGAVLFALGLSILVQHQAVALPLS